MSASPARSLIERAAEAYGYDRAWFVDPAETVPLPPEPASEPEPPAPPVRLVEPAPVAPAPIAPAAESESPPRECDPMPDRDALEVPEDASVPSLSKHGPSSSEESRTALRQPQGERGSRSAFGAVASEAVDPIALAEAGYVLPGAPPGMLSEEFRIAKRALIAAAFGGRGADPVERGRLLLVCSGSSGEGKTFCALNLALSLAAERDARVLLIDGDVAKPDVLRRLGLGDAPGLMDAIGDPSIDPEALVRDTGIANLAVMGAGAAVNDATERLGSARARAVLDALVDGDPRRIVVIDSPPVLVASPATALALHAGQAVLVVRADRTTEAELRRSYALLSGCGTVHLLLNGVTYASGEPGFGSYYAAGAA